MRLKIRRVPRSRWLGLNPSGSAICHDTSSVRRYPASAGRPLASESGLPGHLRTEARRSDRYRRARRGVPGVVHLSEAGGHGGVVELRRLRATRRAPERPGVGSPRVRADGGLHQAPRGLCRPYRSRPLRGHPCCCGNATAFWPSSVVPVIDPRPGGSLPHLPCRVALPLAQLRALRLSDGPHPPRALLVGQRHRAVAAAACRRLSTSTGK